MEPLGPTWTSEALLRFNTMVGGQQLSGRALLLTERGYGVELMSGGQSVAAALLAQKLARLPGEAITANAILSAAVVTPTAAHPVSPAAAAKVPETTVAEPTSSMQEKSTKTPPRKEPAKPAATARE